MSMCRVPVVWAALTLLAALGGCAIPGQARERCDAPTTAVFERAAPAVVIISTLAINPYSLSDRVREGTGSGFLIDPAGLILTNSHVVLGSQHVVVTLADGTHVPARLVGADPIIDVALLKIEPSKGKKLPTLALGDSDKLQPGQDAIAIGAPLGLGYTVTRGVISGLNRTLPDRPLLLSTPFIQIDTPINPGNSGGPLLDRCGKVVGINTAMIAGAQNVGFAVPINLARGAMPSLKRDGRVIRPWFGFQGQFIDSDLISLLRLPLVEGYAIEVVEPGGPAEQSGLVGGELPVSLAGREYLLGGDIITEANGIATTDLKGLAEKIPGIVVGDALRLKVFRNGTYRIVEYELPERPLLPGDLPEEQTYLAPAPQRF